jgi:ATP-dependent exoDNAse (exonuclease V) alpha subunit
MLVLDEASLVANKPMNDLVTIANRLGLDRLVMIGDRAQLQPIDAGKAFTLIQQHRPAMAQLDVSHRQRTEHMKAVASLTRGGHFKDAFEVLGERVVSSGADFRRRPPANGWNFRPRIVKRRRSMLRARDTRASQCAGAGWAQGRRQFAR